MEGKMQEKIIINGFAGLQNAEIDLKRLTLFIGPQASGKSVVAKLLYYLRSFSDDAINALSQKKPFEAFQEDRLRKFDRYFPPAFRSLNGFEINYSLNGHHVIIRGGKKLPLVIDAPQWKKTYQTAVDSFRNSTESFSLHPNHVTPIMVMASVFLEDFKVPMPSPQVFLPDGKSDYLWFYEKMLALQQASYVHEMADPFIADFLTVYTWARQSLQKQYPDWAEAFGDDVLESIILGKIEEKEGETFVKSKDDRLVPLSFASSGQKEMIPVFKMLAFVMRLEASSTPDQMTPFYLEEPETHLFPESQVKVAELVARVLNKTKRSQILMTTHSPYVAASLNNLLYAGQLAEIFVEKRKQVGKIVAEGQWLKRADFAAYRFEGGTARVAVDPETGLFCADVIDQVSNQVGSTFEALLDLDSRG
jgi:predicted ATPase